MTVGLLLITHNDIGSTLLATASRMLGECPLQAKVLAVTEDCEPARMRARAREMAEQIDNGDGVLVLTDMFGSTPSNIANGLEIGPKCLVLAGVNLSMVVRVLNYPELSLVDLAAKALSGGKDGVLICHSRDRDRGRGP